MQSDDLKEEAQNASEFFTLKEQQGFVKYLLEMTEMGFSYTESEIMEMAGHLAHTFCAADPNRKCPFLNCVPDVEWYKSFTRKWTEISTLKTNEARAKKTATKSALQKYYDKLNVVLTINDFDKKPERIFYVESIADSSNMDSAILYAANAVRSSDVVIPAYRWRTSRARIDGIGFDRWLREYFVKNVFKTAMTETTVLLLYDGYASFINQRIVEAATAMNVKLFPQPPRAGDYCDYANCFRPLARIYADDADVGNLDDFVINRLTDIKDGFARDLHAVGILPFNPEKLMSKIDIANDEVDCVLDSSSTAECYADIVEESPMSKRLRLVRPAPPVSPVNVMISDDSAPRAETNANSADETDDSSDDEDEDGEGGICFICSVCDNCVPPGYDGSRRFYWARCTNVHCRGWVHLKCCPKKLATSKSAYELFLCPFCVNKK
ncbi:uncharacterized protein LOC141905776 isoform X3 [Tubulanus polymorphus]